MAIREATLSDAGLIAPLLREGDRRELALTGRPAEEALRIAIESSLEAWIDEGPDGPLAVWGLSAQDILGNDAELWLMTTCHVERNKSYFLREVRSYVERKATEWACLHGLVDSRYAGGVRLLKWLGFRLSPIEGTPLCRFERA